MKLFVSISLDRGSWMDLPLLSWSSSVLSCHSKTLSSLKLFVNISLDRGSWMDLPLLSWSSSVLSCHSKMLSSLTPPKKGFGRAGRKSCWWLEKNVFYPPHLTLDMTNATRDIESNGVTKGFTSWFKTKGCLGFVWKQVGKRCNKSNDKTQCFTRGVSIPELQNFVAFFGFKFCHVFSKIVLSLRDSTLHYITLHYITLHYITLHYITLHYITYIYIYIYK